MTLPDIDPTPSYLVFGATGGIGSELCRHLAAQGARLVLAGRSEEKLGAVRRIAQLRLPARCDRLRGSRCLCGESGTATNTNPT